MPLCFGASGLVRARQTPQCALCAADVHTFCPVRRQPPVGPRTAFVRSAARSEPAPGSLNSWHQINVAAQRARARTVRSVRGCRARGCVGTAHQPITRSGRSHPRRGQLLVDQQLLGRRGVPAVRLRPVRGQQPRLGQRGLALARAAARRRRRPRRRSRAAGVRRSSDRRPGCGAHRRGSVPRPGAATGDAPPRNCEMP